MHVLSSHLPWTGLHASWPGCQGSWPRFHPALPSCQSRLQGEKPTPHRVSPKSFLRRGLQDGLRLGFLPFGAGKSLWDNRAKLSTYQVKNYVPNVGGEPTQVTHGEGGETRATSRPPKAQLTPSTFTSRKGHSPTWCSDSLPGRTPRAKCPNWPSFLSKLRS